jgi:hypothetical protein
VTNHIASQNIRPTVSARLLDTACRWLVRCRHPCSETEYPTRKTESARSAGLSLAWYKRVEMGAATRRRGPMEYCMRRSSLLRLWFSAGAGSHNRTGAARLHLFNQERRSDFLRPPRCSGNVPLTARPAPAASPRKIVPMSSLRWLSLRASLWMLSAHHGSGTVRFSSTAIAPGNVGRRRRHAWRWLLVLAGIALATPASAGVDVWTSNWPDVASVWALAGQPDDGDALRGHG